MQKKKISEKNIEQRGGDGEKKREKKDRKKRKKEARRKKYSSLVTCNTGLDGAQCDVAALRVDAA